MLTNLLIFGAGEDSENSANSSYASSKSLRFTFLCQNPAISYRQQEPGNQRRHLTNLPDLLRFLLGSLLKQWIEGSLHGMDVIRRVVGDVPAPSRSLWKLLEPNHSASPSFRPWLPEFCSANITKVPLRMALNYPSHHGIILALIIVIRPLILIVC